MTSRPNDRLSRLDESGVFGSRMRVERARNAVLTLRDEAGDRRDYLDFMSAYASVNFGHCNPEIQPFTDLSADIVACFQTDEAYDVADWLTGRLGLPEHSVLYQVGGSFAVSTALALAQRVRPGRVMALDGAFHGLGADALAATVTHKNFALQSTPHTRRLDADVTHLPIRQLPTSWDGVSCLIVEPIQGAAGYVPLPEAWLVDLVTSAQRAGVVVISDEIQCGYFRHGVLSPSRRLGLTPDVLLFSKSMTNGLFPLSAVVYGPGLTLADEPAVQLSHTFQTSALGAYAAAAVTRYLDTAPVEAMIASVAGALTAVVEELAGRDGVVRVHQTGPTLSFALPSPVTARQLVRDCLADGVLVFTGGADSTRIRVAPPLTTPADQLEHGLGTLLRHLPADSRVLTH